MLQASKASSVQATNCTTVCCFSRPLPQVHCGDAAVEARLEQKINEACISFEKKPQEVAQVCAAVQGGGQLQGSCTG